MKALVYLLGAHALNVAHERTARPGVPEPALAPVATTEEIAGAWRRWAEAGRTPAARAARRAYQVGSPASRQGAG